MEERGRGFSSALEGGRWRTMSDQTNPLHGPIRVALQNMPLSKIKFKKKKKTFLQIVKQNTFCCLYTRGVVGACRVARPIKMAGFSVRCPTVQCGIMTLPVCGCGREAQKAVRNQWQHYPGENGKWTAFIYIFIFI